MIDRSADNAHRAAESARVAGIAAHIGRGAQIRSIWSRELAAARRDYDARSCMIVCRTDTEVGQ